MRDIKVFIWESRKKFITVKANNPEEAELKVKEMYDEGKINLGEEGEVYIVAELY